MKAWITFLGLAFVVLTVRMAMPQGLLLLGVGDGVTAGGGCANCLLLENGDYLLQENADRLLLE